MSIRPMSEISSYLRKRKEKKAQKKMRLAKLWQEQLEKSTTSFYEHEFNKIKFPILLIEGSVAEENNEFEFDYYEFTIVEDLSEFAGTGWYHSECMENEHKLIDYNGDIWNFKYNNEVKVCTPGSLIKKLGLDEFKSFVIRCINWRNQKEVKDAITKANSISSVFEVIEKYHKSFL